MNPKKRVSGNLVFFGPPRNQGKRETRESQKKLDNRRGRNPRKKNGSKMEERKNDRGKREGNSKIG